MSTKKTTVPPLHQPVELYAAMLDQTVRVNRIVAKGVERAIEEQIGLFESAVDSARPLAAAKLPEDVFSMQLDAWKTLSEKMVVTAGKIAEIQRETSAELKDIVIDGYKTANEMIPKAA